MRSKLTLMLVALLAMAGIATAQTPKKKPLRRSIVASLPSGYTSNDKVKMTAKDGYKFRKVEVKKTPKP